MSESEAKTQNHNDNDVVVVSESEAENRNLDNDVNAPNDKNNNASEEDEDCFEDSIGDELPDANQESEPALRRGQRRRHLPGKLLDFFTSYTADTASNFPLDVPENFKDIYGRPDKDEWFFAVNEELKSMQDNNVWEIVTPPKGAKLLSSKWVFRTKMDENGNLVRHKARLVVKGFLQKEGIDYNETYSPVAKLTTIRIVLAVGVKNGFIFHQLDVKTAFLHGLLKEEIYMSLPEGVINEDKGKACKLIKSLYGLKQAPRCWNQEFNHYILKLGFTRSKHDYCLYTKRDKLGDLLILVLYVDDLLIAGNKLSAIDDLKNS